MFKPHHILRRNPASRLYTDVNSRVYLEVPKPISESLEWRLASHYWQSQGSVPFSDGSVPYIVNNSGWAPRAAANLVIAAGESITGPIIIAEIGAGSGIFARQALDHIKNESPDVYSRLLWICTDASVLAVESWKDREQFLEHADRIEQRVLKAENFDSIELPNGTLLGVMVNYALDSLPLDVVNDNGERLHLRSHICSTEENLEQWLGMSLKEILDSAQSNDPKELDKLLPMLDWLEVTASFVSSDVPYSSEALSAAQTNIAMVNSAALEFLSSAQSIISDGGFILINDYGPTTTEAFANQNFIHRFGGTATGGLNFLHIDQFMKQLGCTVLSPVGDEQRTIHTRLFVLGHSAVLEDEFHQQFSDPRYVQADRIGMWIRSYISSGRYAEALDLFDRHLEWCPTDWFQMAQAAQMFMQQFGQIEEAVELAFAAKELNPWSSTLVWNIYGSTLFSKSDYLGAEKAWNAAINIFNEDPSTWLNFGYLYAILDQRENALQAIAKGLTYDKNGQLRAALLHKQAEIIDRGLQIASEKVDRSSRRHRTLVDTFRPLKSS